MSDVNTVNTVAKVEVSNELSFSKGQMKSLYEAEMIREDYLNLVKGFNARFEALPHSEREVNSKKGIIKMPIWLFKNQLNSFTLWASTMLNALVIEDDSIVTKPVEKAKGLPVYFRDEFVKEHPNLRKLASFRNDDGSFSAHKEYEIVGALVTRSKHDKTRWTVKFKMYRQGLDFLDLANKGKGKKNKKTWLSEEDLISLSKGTKEKRTIKIEDEKVVLPTTAALEIMANADTDPRFASAQFIIRKIW